MGQHLTVHQNSHELGHASSSHSFFTRFRKNLALELSSSLGAILLFFKIFILAVTGIIESIFNFVLTLTYTGETFLELTGKSFGGLFGFTIPTISIPHIAGFILRRVGIYVSGTYLTLLPAYIVVPLVFLPEKIAIPILGISAFLSLFMVFMV